MYSIKILVLSDIHSNFIALEAVLKDAESYDAVICAGDIVGYGPDPGDSVERLKELNPKAVLGNHDVGVTTGHGPVSNFNVYAATAVNINRRLLNQAQLKWLGRLPETLKLDLMGVKVSVFHGSPYHPIWEYIFPQEAKLRAREFLEAAKSDLLILGHTHVPFIHRLDKRILANPGSVGQPRDGDPRASYMTIEIEDEEIETFNHRVRYDIQETEERMRAKGLPEVLYKRLYIGR